MAVNSERKEVFTIIDKVDARGEQAKGWWVRIGTAFVNKDGSLNVKLDALPVNGTMHIRDRTEHEDAERSARGERRDTSKGFRDDERVGAFRRGNGR